MKHTKLIALIAAILLLTAFFLIFPASYLKAKTQSALKIREVALPVEEKTSLSAQELISLMDASDRTNTILYESQDLKSRETYLEKIGEITDTVFSSFPTFRESLNETNAFYETYAEKYEPSIRRFCIVTVSADGSVKTINLIVYRNPEFEICFEETLGTALWYRLEPPLSRTFLNAQGGDLTSARKYYTELGVGNMLLYDQLYDVTFRDYEYTVVIGGTQYYNKWGYDFGSVSYDYADQG